MLRSQGQPVFFVRYYIEKHGSQSWYRTRAIVYPEPVPFVEKNRILVVVADISNKEYR